MPDLRRKGRNGTALILYTVLLPTLLLFVGLGIDLSMLYVVQTRLSAAVDGAALGAGRLLGTQADPKEIAGEFLTANYPGGFWGSYNLTPDITVTNVASLHTIVVNATVQVPLLFLKLLRQQNCTVAASATAVRRDVRVELVLDRSYSMLAQIDNLKIASANFVNMFNPGTDELGLVVFGATGFVAYPNPTSPPNTNWVGGNGPDTHFADPVSGNSENLITTINGLQVGSDTNTSEALWLAYLELKKAVAADNDTTRANVIVLFTDGLPNGFTAYLNDPKNNALGANSNCYYNPATGASNQMIGAVNTAGDITKGIGFFDPNDPGSTGSGFYSLLIFDKSASAYSWASNPNPLADWQQVSPLSTPMRNCVHIGQDDLSGLAKIPPQDYYGNSTTNAAYTQSLLYKTYKVAYDSTKPNSGYQMGLASWNVVDNAARKILSDTNMNVAIYTIGFTGNGGVDDVLLKRMANTQDSTSYNANYQSGLYVPASDSQTLQRAFGQVASEVLKLSH